MTSTNLELLFAAALLLGGCGSAEGAVPSDPPVIASGATAPDPCGDTRSATLSQVKHDVFTSCRSSSCHGSGGHAGDLDLDADPHKALVGVAPDPKGAAARGWTVPRDVLRVAPGDESKSLLYLKLTMPTAKDAMLGHRMPDTGQTLEACDAQKVRDWIRRGAPND